MQAVILAGGLATRLGELSAATPKSLIEVAGRPFIAWQLERIAACGFEEVVLCVAHLSAPIRAYVADGRSFGLRVLYSEEDPNLLGTGGALRHALPLLESEFLVTYGDSYLPFDYAAPLRELQADATAFGSMAVFANRNRWEASNVSVAGNRVRRYVKGGADPNFDHIDYGATALRREVLNRYPPEAAFGLERVQQELAEAGKLGASVARERFFEIGSRLGLAALERHLRRA